MTEEMVFLGMGTLKSCTLPFSYATGIISDGNPVWLYVEDKQIVATRNLPDNTGVLPAIRELKHYGVHLEKNRRPPRVMTFPPYLMRAAGLANGDILGVYRRSGNIVFRRIEDNSKIAETFQYNLRKRLAVDGEVRGGRVLRFSAETREKMGLSRNCWLHIKVNMVDGCWLEIGKMKPGLQIPSLGELRYKENRKRVMYSANGEFRMFYSDFINLPVDFLRESRLTGTREQHVQLPHWLNEDGWFVLEGLPLRCERCGEEIRRYRNKSCGKCGNGKVGER